MDAQVDEKIQCAGYLGHGNDKAGQGKHGSGLLQEIKGLGPGLFQNIIDSMASASAAGQ